MRIVRVTAGIGLLHRNAPKTPIELSGSLHYCRASEVAVVTAIDRLGHSVAEVTRTIADLGQRRIACVP
jgi:hypothetical protein